MDCIRNPPELKKKHMKIWGLEKNLFDRERNYFWYR